MSNEKRRYELRVRAERQQETRRRIVEATVDLHREVGPAQTTIAEIARRAGVQRLTVYNHFPEQAELFAACQSHHLAQHPPPNFEHALAHDDPRTRVRSVLRDLYAWYRLTEPMLAKVQRDRTGVSALDDLMTRTTDVRLAEYASTLTTGFEGDTARKRRLRAFLGVAVNFWTWQRLCREGLDDAAAADLMADAAASLA